MELESQIRSMVFQYGIYKALGSPTTIASFCGVVPPRFLPKNNGAYLLKLKEQKLQKIKDRSIVLQMHRTSSPNTFLFPPKLMPTLVSLSFTRVLPICSCFTCDLMPPNSFAYTNSMLEQFVHAQERVGMQQKYN